MHVDTSLEQMEGDDQTIGRHSARAKKPNSKFAGPYVIYIVIEKH